MVSIGSKKVDWNAVRAEYIAGGISQRKLAEKYSIPYPTLRDKAKKEGWSKSREDARSKAVAETVQKTASAAAKNALIAQRIQTKLLERIERTIDTFPRDATEVRMQKNGNTLVFRLSDLTRSYIDITEKAKDATDQDEGVKVIVDV